MRTKRPWEPVLRELHRRFKTMDDQILLLNHIDNQILENHKESFENTVIFSLNKIASIYKMSAPPLCYVNTGQGYSLLNRTESYPVIIDDISNFDPESIGNLLIASSRDNKFKSLFNIFEKSQTILIKPFKYPDDNIFALILVPCQDIEEVSVLTDINFQDYLDSVINQLRIAASYFFEQNKSELINNIWDTFLKEDIAPTKCLQYLATKSPSFLTSFGDMKPKGKIFVQILINDSERENLIIRASSSNIPDTTRVHYANSITGLLINASEKDLPFFYDNPQKNKYRHLYKSYNPIDKNEKIQSEFAIRLKVNDSIIGILNFESTEKLAFSKTHILDINQLAKRIASIVNALENRLQINREMHFALTDTTSKYLESLGKSFNHLVGTPSSTLRGDLDLINTIIKMNIEKLGDNFEHTQKTEVAFDRLYDSLNQILTTTTEFTEKISGFSEKGKYSIKKLVKESIALFKKSILGKQKPSLNIYIQPSIQDAEVYCSPLIVQYLFCLLHNSYLSIRSRMTKDASDGIITLSGKEIPIQGKNKEINLNREYELIVEDNGIGVPPDELLQLKRFQFGLRFRKGRGSGYGLVATQRYLASIEGRVAIDSEMNKFFKVMMYLDVWNDILHQPLVYESVFKEDKDEQ